jgi:ribosomal protein L11 methyltransferase
MESFWKKQWEAHAVGFKNGYAHFEIGGKTLKMIPGCGFGDGSHPSTQFILSLMSKCVKDKNVVDMGCGSGILSLAAKIYKPHRVIGVDIDNKALAHARKNAKINGFDISFVHTTSFSCPEKAVVFCNMIRKEQDQVLPLFLDKAESIILSGLLLTDRNERVALMKKNGFILIEEKSDGKWLALRLQKQ